MCLCVYLSLCACVCMHVHVCANVCLNMCACGYVHMWVCMNVSACVYMSICICVSMCAYACLDTHTHVCKPECAWPVCICMRVCVHVPTCVCLWACVCILSPSSSPSSSASVYLPPLKLITVPVGQTQINHQCVCVLVAQWQRGCSPPGSSVHGIFQARILEWVAMPSSRGSSHPRDQTQVFCIAGRFFTLWTTTEAQIISEFYSFCLQIFVENPLCPPPQALS